MEEIKLPPAERAAKTAIGAGSSGKGTVGTYLKADALFSEKKGTKLDFGSGRGEGAKLIKADTYEPYVKSKPKFNNVNDIKSNSYNKITSLNVLNVLPPEARNEAVKNIGRILKPNGEAIVSTRGVKDVESAKNKVQIKDGYIIGKGDDARFQKGFTATELKNYVQKTLGKNFTVENVKGIGKAAIKIKKLNIPKGFGGVTRQEGTPVIDIQEKLLFNPRQKFSSGGDAMDNEMLSFSELERFRKENDYYHNTDPRNPMNTEGMDLANPEVQKEIIEELNDRKKLDVISEMPISRKAGQRIKERRLEEALEKGKALKINKGGSIPQQMEMFQDGGLKDEGNTVDPVSGNEVPPGATQEEVRDDIPAQLSEGEFVFPADVVRYIGLEKLMMMRQEAKAGLARMEEMGQMGNADEATLPDDMPFTLDDLDTREETEDDVIKANIGTFVPPKFPTGQPYNPNVNPYQPTGVVPTSYSPYKPATGTGLLAQGAPEAENRRYVNKTTGQVRMIPFNKATGQSLYPIPEGFVFEPEAPKEEAKTTKVQTTKVQPVDTGSGDDKSKNISGAVDLAGDPLSYKNPFEMDALDKDLVKIAGFQTSLLNPKTAVGQGLYSTMISKKPETPQMKLSALTPIYTRAKKDLGYIGRDVATIKQSDRDVISAEINRVSDAIDRFTEGKTTEEVVTDVNKLADKYGLENIDTTTNINISSQIGSKIAEVNQAIQDQPTTDMTQGPDESIVDDDPVSDSTGISDFEGGATESDIGAANFDFKQGGLAGKKKTKVKKMKRGGLASKK